MTLICNTGVAESGLVCAIGFEGSYCCSSSGVCPATIPSDPTDNACSGVGDNFFNYEHIRCTFNTPPVLCSDNFASFANQVIPYLVGANGEVILERITNLPEVKIWVSEDYTVPVITTPPNIFGCAPVFNGTDYCYGTGSWDYSYHKIRGVQEYTGKWFVEAVRSEYYWTVLDLLVYEIYVYFKITNITFPDGSVDGEIAYYLQLNNNNLCSSTIPVAFNVIQQIDLLTSYHVGGDASCMCLCQGIGGPGTGCLFLLSMEAIPP